MRGVKNIEVSYISNNLELLRINNHQGIFKIRIPFLRTVRPSIRTSNSKGDEITDKNVLIFL